MKEGKLLPFLLTYLVEIIKRQRMIIFVLMTIVIMLMQETHTPHLTSPDNLNYQKLKIEKFPLNENVEKLDYHVLLQKHLKTLRICGLCKFF